MFEVKPGATLLYPSGPADDPRRNHLFVVMTPPSGPAKQVLIVPVCSKHEHSDPTCVIKTGEHPFIRHDSVVEYRRARVDVTAEQLMRGVGKKELVPKEPISEALFARIRAGFQQSRFVKPFARQFLKDYG